jgi:hypothetical protein
MFVEAAGVLELEQIHAVIGAPVQPPGQSAL